MNEPYAPAPGYSNQPGYPPPQKQGMGCFAKGCLTLIVVLMLLGVIIGAAGWYMFHNFTAFVSPTPVAIRTYPATEEQYKEVLGRYGAFIQALNEGKAATLALSADDWNTLIARAPEFKTWRGKVYVSIEKDEIVAETSFLIPDDSRRPSSASRSRGYFNGRARFVASYSSGEWTVYVRRIESMDGKPMSDLLLSILNKIEPAQFVNQYTHDERRSGAAWAEALSRVEKIVIQDGKIVATAVEGTAAANPVPLPGESPTITTESPAPTAPPPPPASPSDT